MSWLLLRDAPAPGSWNMALDDALLEAAGTEGLMALRLYSWDPPALSFGRNEPASQRYDRKRIEAQGLATVRRPTGGRAVWHNREVTYSVVAPTDTFGSLRDTYQELHLMLAEALNALGADVALAPDRGATPLGAGSCFATAAGGEVMARGGAKLVGSAQVRRGAAFLQHGSILIAAEQDVVSAVTLGNAAAPSDSGLADRIGARAVFDSVAAAVGAAAERRWSIGPGAAALPARVRDLAADLEPRYADAAWTWRR